MSLLMVASPCFFVWLGIYIAGFIFKDNDNQKNKLHIMDKDIILSFMMCSAIGSMLSNAIFMFMPEFIDPKLKNIEPTKWY